MRPNRVQWSVVGAELAQVLDAPTATRLMEETGIGALPDLLPAGPRTLADLQAELDPFVRLYGGLLPLLGRETALQVMRRIITRSGLVSHGDDARRQQSDPHDISLTSPPTGPVTLTWAELQAAFAEKMGFFSCQGTLEVYTPDELRFTITQCNWCEAMRAAGTPELTTFLCETDWLSMDGHPTHEFQRPTTIHDGDGRCDFRFIRRGN